MQEVPQALSKARVQEPGVRGCLLQDRVFSFLERLQSEVTHRWSAITSILSQLSRMRRIRNTSGNFMIEIFPLFLECREK